MPTVVGLGDPIVDVLIPLSHVSFDQLGLERGGSTPLDSEAITQLLDQIPEDTPKDNTPGGSAANVIKGLANLAQAQRSARFMGMIGPDDAGREVHRHLQSQNVQPLLLTSKKGTPTASCICLVTPDGERTMRPHLGAAAELTSAEQLPHGWTDQCRLLHCEGYCLYRPQLAIGAMQTAKDAGAEVSLDTASFEVVTNCWPSLLHLLQQGLVDVLLCNEDEALAVAKMAGLTLPSGSQDDVQSLQAVQQFLLQHCKVCVVSRGSKPCLVQSNSGEKVVAATPEVTVKDTVGAGDCFAAGFLHAYLAGASLKACAECACMLGSAAVATAGAELTTDQWQQLQQQVARHLTVQLVS